MIFLFRSSDFTFTFEDNTSSRFKVKLAQRTTFESAANLTLLHIRVPPLSKDTFAFIYCSCVDIAQVGTRGGRLLQVIALEKSESSVSYAIATPLGRGLSCTPLEEIKFTIRAEDGALVEFEEGATTLVLQIQ